MSTTVDASGVGIQYEFDRQQRTITPTLAHLRRGGAVTWALRDVSFAIRRGEGVALLGASGSGKSTLLRVLAGVLLPDTGRLEVHGRVGSLLSIQAGLMSPLTGRENTLLLGVLAGMSPDDARSGMEAVKAASGLAEHYERLVGSYSQGMRARLGLAVIERTEPAILLLDEVHEALDHEFREHVEHYVQRLLAAGGAVIATGHDHHMLERFCTRAILLDQGRLTADGEFSRVQRTYLGDRRA